MVANAEDAGTPETPHELNRRLAREALNDYGNARRLLARYGRDLIYVHGAGWYYWDGRVWREDKSGNHARRFAHLTAVAIREELKAIEQEGPAEFHSEKAYASFHDSLKKWAKASGNHQRLTAMVANAAPYLERDVATLDANPMLFNVKNGTLDLGGGEVRLIRPRREHYITRSSEVEYDPDAPRPVFNHFLDTIMPDAQTQTFLQRFYGYCLTGDTSEQKLVMSCGRGGNGKSTLNNVLRVVFGDYATSLKFESLQQDDKRRGSEANPDLAELPGVRLVIAAEPDTNVKLSTAIIKRFTGGEPLKVRKLNEAFFEFSVQFKLALSFNDKPAIPAQDDGTWRRPLLVMFNTRIPDAMKDRDIDAKLAREAAGVLNWLLDGFREWREKGLAPPEPVVLATEQYRAENDPLGQFLKERVREAKGQYVLGSEMYEEYRKWCNKNGISHPLTNTKFGTLLPQRGYVKVTKGTVQYLDVELYLDPDTMASSSDDRGGYYGE